MANAEFSTMWKYLWLIETTLSEFVCNNWGMLTELSKHLKQGHVESEGVPTAASVFMVGRQNSLKCCFRKREKHKLSQILPCCWQILQNVREFSQWAHYISNIQRNPILRISYKEYDSIDTAIFVCSQIVQESVSLSLSCSCCKWLRKKRPWRASNKLQIHWIFAFSRSINIPECICLQYQNVDTPTSNRM